MHELVLSVDFFRMQCCVYDDRSENDDISSYLGNKHGSCVRKPFSKNYNICELLEFGLFVLNITSQPKVC